MEEETSFDNSSGGTNALMQQKVSLIDRQLDVDAILFTLKADLLGLRFDAIKREYVKDSNAKAAISKVGANKLLSTLKLYLEHPVVLGNLDDDEAMKFAKEYEINATCQIAENSRLWDVEKISDLDTFISASGTLVYCNFTRSISAKTFNGFISMAQLREVHTQATHEREIQQEKLGWKAKLKTMFG